MATKTTTKSSKAPAGKSAAARKPRTTTAKKTVAVAAEKEAVIEQAAPVIVEKKTLGKGKYVFATGRRKTAIANVRMFEGKGESVVNKLPLEKYFSYEFFQEEIKRPFEAAGLLNNYHFIAHVNGGGHHAQAQALRHGISIALGQLSEEVRKVLKKNDFLTRDDRKKERKKPGLKRARRSPQWAKR